MGGIYTYKTKAGSTHYYSDLHVNGKRYRKFLGLSRRTAEKALKELEYELRFAKSDGSKYVTYSGAIEKFLIHVELTGTAYTQVKYIGSRLEAFRQCCEANGNDNFRKVSKQDCRDFMTVRANMKLHNLYSPDGKQRKRPAISTLNREIGYQRRFYKFIIDNDWCNSNPWDSIPRFKSKGSNKPRYAFKKEELEIIFENAGRFYDFYFLLLQTGIRATDGFILKSSAFNGNSLTIKQRKTGDWIQNIPVPSNLTQHLSSRIQSGGYLFPELQSDRQRRNVRKHLQSLFEPNFVRENNINLHTFRHTYARRKLDSGMPKEILQSFLGHKSIRTTEIYANWVSNSELMKWVE